MERLRAAIEKARNASHATGDAQNARSAEFVAPGTHQLPVPRVELWSSLRTTDLTPESLAEARIVSATGEGSDSTAFDALRSRLHRLCEQNTWRRIAITAPTRHCGTTTFALNIAFSFARRTAAKVIVVDLHAHAPAIASRLGMVSPGPLGAAIAGETPVSEILHRVGEKLIFAAGSSFAGRSASVPSDASVERFLADLQSRYQPDVMLLDIPPILMSEQSLSLTGSADAALLIASAETTTAAELDESARLISSHTSYLGAVLNKSRDRSVRRRSRALA